MTKVRLIPVRAKMPKEEAYYRPSVEHTGRGDLLCYDGYGGRWFRSSRQAVEEAVDHLLEQYENGEWINYNDLYMLLGMAESDFGEQNGWSPSEDWKVNLGFIIDFATKEEHRKNKENNPDMRHYFKWIDEDFLIVEPEPGAWPTGCYWEV